MESTIYSKYSDYSQEIMDAKEKLWLCEKIIEEGNHVIEFCNNHKLPLRRIKKYMQKYRDQKAGLGHAFHQFSGRPHKVDKEGRMEIQKKLTIGRAEQKALTNIELKKAILTEIVATKKRRGIGSTDHATFSKSSIKRIKEEMSVNEEKGQFKTHARIKEEADPRNPLTMFCMCVAFCSALVSAMIFNWDATQFRVTADKFVTLCSFKDDDLTNTVTAESAGTTDFFIKLYHFHNAAGNPAPPCFVIADASMGEDELITYRVPGLGNTSDVTNYGYLCYTKTRCGNTRFYEWYARTIVIPFIELVRSTGDFKVYLSLIHI